MKRTIKTEWRYATYDVWGNASDGYEVNDVYLASLSVLSHESLSPIRERA